tara:strand:+ start:2034 stop:3005 length:972 start_codon:yes stop_codon:yes gene_type:complete
MVNLGILGCANIAERHIVPALKRLTGQYNIVGVGTRNKKRGELFKSKFNLSIYDNYESIVNNEAINAVYIPLPNSLHEEWIENSLKTKKHILVEKSLTTSFDAALRVNKIAEKQNLVLVENFQFRFHIQTKKIKQLLNDEEIGEIRNVRSTFCFPPFANKENIRYQKKLGGGSLLDAGAYPVKVSQIILGDNLEVVDSNLYLDKTFGLDTWGNATLKCLNSSVCSQIAFGFDNFYQCNLEILGSRGKITADRIFTSPPGSVSAIKLENDNGTKIIKLEPCNHFENMLLYFYDLVKGKRNLKNEYVENINQSRLINEIKEKTNR